MRWALGVNAAIVVCAATAPIESVPGPVRLLAAGLVVLVLPGLGWLGAFRRAVLDPPRLALAVVGVPEKAFPVPKYNARRFRSRIGVTQMPAPAGASMSFPREFFPTTFGASAMVYVFQIGSPVAASSADR